MDSPAGKFLGQSRPQVELGRSMLTLGGSNDAVRRKEMPLKGDYTDHKFHTSAYFFSRESSQTSLVWLEVVKRINIFRHHILTKDQWTNMNHATCGREYNVDEKQGECVKGSKLIKF